MTDEEIRIEVASHCGYHECGYRHQDGYIDNDGVFRTKGNPEFSPVGCGVMTDSRGRIVPDYPNDLNAMHKIIMSLDSHHKLMFCMILMDIVGNGARFEAINATARQRAEAFIQVLSNIKS